MTAYEPRTIISPEQYDEYLLDLHRTLATIAEDQDPPNPFRGLIEEGDNVRVVVNDTNDLHFCIEHFNKKINASEAEHVVIGDPNTLGYTIEALERMMDGLDATFTKNKQWIIVMLNTSNKKLVIKNRKLKVEKN